MTDANTVDVIVAAAKANRTQLVSLDHDLQTEIDKIIFAAAKQDREMSRGRKNRRKLYKTSKRKSKTRSENWRLLLLRAWTIRTP